MGLRKDKHTTQVTLLAQDPQLVGIQEQDASWSGLKPCVFYTMPYFLLRIGLFNYFCLYFTDFSMGTCSTGLDLGQSVLGCETQGMRWGRGVCPVVPTGGSAGGTLLTDKPSHFLLLGPVLPPSLPPPGFALASGLASFFHPKAFCSAWALTPLLPLSLILNKGHLAYSA